MQPCYIAFFRIANGVLYVRHCGSRFLVGTRIYIINRAQLPYPTAIAVVTCHIVANEATGPYLYLSTGINHVALATDLLSDGLLGGDTLLL